VLVAPADEVEMKLALEFALNEKKPVVVRYPKDFVPADEFDRAACSQPFELGKSVVVRSSTNSAIVVVTYGSVLTEALKAAQALAEDGIEVDVINARFAVPIDEKIISLLDQGKAIVTVEDHRLACGFGSAVLESAAAAFGTTITKSILPLGIPKQFIRHNSRRAQLMEIGINADKIAQTAKKMLTLT